MTFITTVFILTLFCSPGSQLVAVNGMKVGAMSVEQIRGLLASIPGGDINLVVQENQTMTRYYF